MSLINVRQLFAKLRPPVPETRAAALPAGSIEIDAVTKRFRRRTAAKKSYATVKSDLMRWLASSEVDEGGYFKALDDISLSIPPGSSIGIIGRNGSGKSSLLKLIAGIYRPDAGTVKVSGRISALIELGAGFHPDFTGRENVYLGGIMYGLSREEIDAKFDAIVRYAELEDVIDDPVRTYSSGMYMRLGFSLAIHTDPDILLVDEVLAVGDAPFINRCQDTISEFRRKGKTLIFVTHDLPSVARWCDEAIWLNRGVIKERGEPRQIIDRYLSHVEGVEEAELDRLNAATEEEEAEEISTTDVRGGNRRRWGKREVELLDVQMLDASGKAKWLFHSEEAATVEVRYRINAPIEDLEFGVGILRLDGMDLHGSNTAIDEARIPLPPEEAKFPVEGTYRYTIERLSLLEDSYYLDVAAHRSDGYPYDYHHRLYKFSVRSNKRYSGVYSPAHSWSFSPEYQTQALLKSTAKTGTES